MNDLLLAGLVVFLLIGIMEALGRRFGGQPKWTKHRIHDVFCMRVGTTHRIIGRGMDASQAAHRHYVDGRYVMLSEWDGMRRMKNGGCTPFPPIGPTYLGQHSTLTHS